MDSIKIRLGNWRLKKDKSKGEIKIQQQKLEEIKRESGTKESKSEWNEGSNEGQLAAVMWR